MFLLVYTKVLDGFLLGKQHACMRKIVNLLNHYFILCLLFVSCSIHKRNVTKFQHNFEFVEMKDTFEMEIIDFTPSFQCGGFAQASSCLGINLKNGDTIRVLSLCNTDSTFKGLSIVKVYPRDKPLFEVGTPYIIEPNGTEQKYKTTFGTLKKK